MKYRYIYSELFSAELVEILEHSANFRIALSINYICNNSLEFGSGDVVQFLKQASQMLST